MKQIYKYISVLKRPDRKPELIADSLLLLDPERLKKQNTIALILDFDGVLAYEGDLHPLPEIIEWLDKAIEIFGSKKIFILSNNPLPQRKLFFEKYFNNNIIFITAKPKPSTEGIEMAYKILDSDLKFNKSQILLIDDRLLTGILAAKIFGVSCCLIRKPYVNLKHKVLKEIFFILLRLIERTIIWRL